MSSGTLVNLMINIVLLISLFCRKEDQHRSAGFLEHRSTETDRPRTLSLQQMRLIRSHQSYMPPCEQWRIDLISAAMKFISHSTTKSVDWILRELGSRKKSEPFRDNSQHNNRYRHRSTSHAHIARHSSTHIDRQTPDCISRRHAYTRR